MLDLFHIAKPQGCDIQTFYGNGAVSNSTNVKSWTKPRGVSHVYMMLIGSGGNGDGSTGGGSGAVTVWYGAAQHVPDQLDVHVGQGNGQASQIKYRTTSGTPYTLLIGDAASGVSGGAAASANQFTASGFFNSVAGQAGSGGSSQSASSTTFLSGGTFSTGTVTANYGYGGYNAEGIFMLQPIIVGSASGKVGGAGGVGCGGNSSGSGKGGQGMVLIASW
jgi:hypothetical protein